MYLQKKFGTEFVVCQSEPSDPESYYYTKRDCDFPARTAFYKLFSVTCKPLCISFETQNHFV